MRRLRRLRQRDSSGAALLHRLRVAIGQQAEAPLEAIDRALDEAPPPLKTSVLALAARTTSVDFIEPVLQRAKLLERGRQRVYNAEFEQQATWGPPPPVTGDDGDDERLTPGTVRPTAADVVMMRR